MVIDQGDVYWINIDETYGFEPGYRHPYVLIQNNVFNHSRLRTTVACALTLNLKRANAPGNVLLEKGEANLSKQSVVNVSQLFTVDKEQLGEYIGSLSPSRIQQILAGIYRLLEPRQPS